MAADMHYAESPMDQVVLDSDNAGNIPADLHDLSANDHCSHGCSHLLGLNSTPAKPSTASSHRSKSAYLVNWNSLLNPPPARPPKA